MANNITIHIEDHSPEVLAALHNAIIRGGDAIGEKAVQYAVKALYDQNAVDTGNLAGSISYQVKEE